jgi:hypothetical protein
MGPTNMVPMVMMTAGVTATATVGERVAERVMDTVKTGITEFELAGIRDVLLAESVAGVDIKRLSQNTDKFKRFLQDPEVMQQQGGRDPSVDLWENDYMLEGPFDQEEYLVFSVGPNRTPDACRGSAVEVSQELQSEVSEWDIDEYSDENYEAASNDDVCMPFVAVNELKGIYRRIGE